MDCPIIDVFHGSHEIAGRDIEGIDRAAVGVVRNQEHVAEWSKVARCYCKAPRLIQRNPLCQTPHMRSVFVKGINKTARTSGHACKRNIEQTVYVPDTKRREARWKGRVGKRPN